MDLRLKHNSAMLVVGPSQSGKSQFVDRLLAAQDRLFDLPPNRVRWFYGIYQPEHAELAAKRGYELQPGLPGPDLVVQPRDVIVLDDLMQESGQSSIVTDLFTKLAHHRRCLVILLTQNLFQTAKQARTQSLNAHYIVMMKNPRDKTQASLLGRQIMPGSPGFFSAIYQDATRKPYSYLFIDLHQETPESARFRTRILPDEQPTYTYVPVKKT